MQASPSPCTSQLGDPGGPLQRPGSSGPGLSQAGTWGAHSQVAGLSRGAAEMEG